MLTKEMIEKGRWWEKGLTLVSGCTKTESEGCRNCWALALESRFRKCRNCGSTLKKCMSLGHMACCTKCDHSTAAQIHPERLSIPLKTRKPTVWSVWNDLYHKDVPNEFRHEVYAHMIAWTRHTFLVLSKRPQIMADYLLSEIPLIKSEGMPRVQDLMDNIWHGLTICNQQEADEKIPTFLCVHGKRFLSVEPCLGPIDISHWLFMAGEPIGQIHAVLMGGETGQGARPMNPDWVRSLRDQCANADVPFFLKHINKKEGRILDGVTHDKLPWHAVAP